MVLNHTGWAHKNWFIMEKETYNANWSGEEGMPKIEKKLLVLKKNAKGPSKIKNIDNNIPPLPISGWKVRKKKKTTAEYAHQIKLRTTILVLHDHNNLLRYKRNNTIRHTIFINATIIYWSSKMCNP
ncbi:hypothetical protein EGW08_000402 [Elysia chlorotica]|uniref:Uncharacterized protein n=1 Tax=Elysia chlorotica TaxID=188477 RepID=A0A3S1A6H2_ELYCH|nr:hypothetical protein EGW08_000402 [Elysia chlorotica]